ncbi:MAG TPA: 3,4-dihydroxy-2-butanone-4-phosphate synthase, partial [Candidatus Micrarchaeota archaeon]|nr:3,4-dihydroxy-2-butanone-4-phosphate synthase [Candidatus Micrarchaeota archaeon]
EKVRRLRRDAGGLICLAVGGKEAKRLKLRFATDLLFESGSPVISKMAGGRMAYGDKPSFSISINHLSVFTGITDNDRAKTISEFGKLVARKGTAREFSKGFRAIGHVFLLIGSGLEKRRGHTELALELAVRAGAPQAVVVCEMLSGTGRAASRQAAIRYAGRNGFPFLDGKGLVDSFRQGKRAWNPG